MRYLSLLLLAGSFVIGSAAGAYAHRWNMRAFEITWGMNPTMCRGFVVELAQNINRGMEKKGYAPGEVYSRPTAAQLDGVGGTEISYYFLCSEYSLIFATSHTADDSDSATYDVLYQVMLQQFAALKKKYTQR
jgi:hypothetical protein